MKKEEFVSGGNGALNPNHVVHLGAMYKDWFLDYASYVILERAVPYVDDGLKPVQRRILHALRDLEDGRYNKVANVIGHTMKYHPHGDTSIGDALVQLGQKELLIDMQGNWGNTLTGDSAAAPRYIEARLSKFALEVVFNPKTTVWQSSYDGRNREPVALPVKFPLLLAQGVEGIAVGLACKVLPHNFVELIDASINVLRGRSFEILPDFLSGGVADFSQYNDGLRGGRVRIRAKIASRDRNTLVISEIPFGTTTTSLIESIVAANEKGKIKIKKVDDNTSERVEILVHLPPGTPPETMINALYVFTDCEVSVSPNACIIENDTPKFIGVSEIFKICTGKTVDLLRKELELRLGELNDQWHFSSLEKIFIENRIYRDIEECETWEAVIDAIDKGLEPFKHRLRREVTHEDIVRLTEIKIKRISRYDSFRADEQIRGVEKEMEEVQHNLDHLIDYAVAYFKSLKKKFGSGRERRTEIGSFEAIVASRVAVANEKLYVNRAEGFAGYGLKKDEFVEECSSLDDIIVFREDGSMIVTRVSEKAFVGKGLLYIAVFKGKEDKTLHTMIYRDGESGNALVKKFMTGGITRDKVYDLTKGTKGSKVLYFAAHPEGANEVVTVRLRPSKRVKKTSIDFDFGALPAKGRGSAGNILTKHAVANVRVKQKAGRGSSGEVSGEV